MRWRIAGIVGLIVLLMQAPAAALWHDWWFRPDEQDQEGPAPETLATSAGAVVVVTGAEAVAVEPFVAMSSGWYPAILISAAGVSLSLLISSYVFALLFKTGEAAGWGQILLMLALNLGIQVLLVASARKVFYARPLARAQFTPLTLRLLFPTAVILGAELFL